MAPDGGIFRKDYEYVPSVDGWMKLHLIPTRWYDARLICHNEGARLASPLNEDMYLQLTTISHVAGRPIHTGVHTIASTNDYFSIEGVPLSDMPISWAEGEPNNSNASENCLTLDMEGLSADVNCYKLHSFVCYREKSGVAALNECGNHDNDYSRDNRTGSCYKFHKTRMPWLQAHSVCTAEGGHLAIINSDTEAEVLAALARKANNNSWTYIGFRDWSEDRVRRWATLDGKTLEEAGYARWAPGEPNQLGGCEKCGSFIQKGNENLGLNDSDCDREFHFICEIDPPKLSTQSL